MMTNSIKYYFALNMIGGITEYCEFLGKKYFNFGNGYFKQTNNPYSLLHHDIWRHHGKEIPKGFEIHHIDHNKRNNSIENLEAITKSDHTRLHQEESPVRRFKCVICKKYFHSKSTHNVKYCPTCYAKHDKERKSKWAKENRLRLNEKSLEKYHREKHDDKRVCVVCGKDFFTYKYAPNFCCGSSCAAKYKSIVNPLPKRFCSTHGCNRIHYAKGLCRPHYKKSRRS